MAVGGGNIISGFLEGLIRRTNTSEEFEILAFADKVGNAQLTYTTENLTVETFSANGLLGLSGSCPIREALTITLESQNLAWAFLQAATNTLAQDADFQIPESFSVVASTVDATPATTIELPSTPAVGTEVIVADEDGIQYPVDTVSGTTVTLTQDITGTKVTVQWVPDPTGTNNQLSLGAGSKLGEVGVFGRFFGCPETYKVAVPRGIIQANLDLSVDGSSPGTAALTIQALRDNNGNFGYLRREV